MKVPTHDDVEPAEQAGSREKMGKVTIAQIAAAAGVSAATVSKVLNGNSEVSAATRERVQSLLLKHGYKRRASSRNAAPPVIDLVFARLDSAWAMEIVKGAVSAAASAGLTIALTSLAEGSGAQSWLDQICARGTRGVILLLARLGEREKAELWSRGLPFAVVDPQGQQDPTVTTVGATNWSGGLAATRHLIELGHRRIGMISGPADLLCSRARMDGYRSAMEAGGLPLAPELMQWSNFRVDGGFKVATAMLSLPERPTAIFAGSDLQALGVLEAARVQHLRVPDDLSLVGFDDLPLSRWTSPPLTTIRQPLAEMASTAVRLLLTQDGGERPEARSVELATTLVLRETTAPPCR
jgi:DNA-binding LacI/PurR family transcriptional regulator